RRVAGIVLLGGLLDDEQLATIDEGTPLIVVGRSFAAAPDRSLEVDNLEAAERLTRYLLELGHQRIAHIAGPSFTSDSGARPAGYELALRAAVAMVRVLAGDDAALPVFEPELVVRGSAAPPQA